jgi:hypothetical protein
MDENPCNINASSQLQWLRPDRRMRAGGKPTPRFLVIRTKIIPKSDTALVVCAEQPQYVCGITGVDEKSTWAKTDGGKTPWVRVLPGDRVIRLTLSNNHLINRPWLKIKGVQAGHVYRIDAGFDGKALTASYEPIWAKWIATPSTSAVCR